MRPSSFTLWKALLHVARAVWLVFFFTGLLGGIYYLFARDEMSLGIFLGSLAVAGLPWSILVKILPACGIYMVVRGFVCFIAALLNYRWIARELHRVRLNS